VSETPPPSSPTPSSSSSPSPKPPAPDAPKVAPGAPPGPARATSREEASHYEWLRWLALSAVVVTVVLIVAWQFVEPAPPSRVVIAAGPADGNYYAVAHRYAEYFAERGIELQVRETAGSIENYRLIVDRAEGVDAAIVQGGTLPDDDERTAALEAVVSIYHEPLFIFHRAATPTSRIADLTGRRVAIGPVGSGTRALALRLLAANGITAENTTLLPQGGEAAAAALREGAIDAALFVIAPDTPYIADLLADDAVALLPIDRAAAYGRRFHYLSRVTLHRGVVDLARDLPRDDVPLIAPAASIIAHDDTHPAVIQLLVRAATTEHRGGSMLSPPGQFPSETLTDLPVSDDARYYLNTPPGLLDRTLPFWAAQLVNRLLIMLLPLAVVLIPLGRLMPPIYRWQIRSRIYKWYRRLRRIDAHLRSEPDPDTAHDAREELDRIEKEIGGVRVPLSYMEEAYNLRLHVGYVRNRLEEYERGRSSPPASS